MYCMGYFRSLLFAACEIRRHYWYSVNERRSRRRDGLKDRCKGYSSQCLFIGIYIYIYIYIYITLLETYIAWKSSFTSQALLSSMHRYQPRVHLIRFDNHSDVCTQFKTFIFPETQFIAVTAYQNNKVFNIKLFANKWSLFATLYLIEGYIIHESYTPVNQRREWAWLEVTWSIDRAYIICLHVNII